MQFGRLLFLRGDRGILPFVLNTALPERRALPDSRGSSYFCSVRT
jgi:hypothetical protein